MKMQYHRQVLDENNWMLHQTTTDLAISDVASGACTSALAMKENGCLLMTFPKTVDFFKEVVQNSWNYNRFLNRQGNYDEK